MLTNQRLYGCKVECLHITGCMGIQLNAYKSQVECLYITGCMGVKLNAHKSQVVWV